MATAHIDHEAQRQAALDAMHILGTDRSAEFDIFPDLASQMFGTPIAAISLVDRNRQWFKASVGLDVTETPRAVSFCAHAIQRPEEVLCVPDATKDRRFADNPLVSGEFGLRFYAGVPIIGPSGHALGAVCVIDRKAREVSEAALKQLRMLAIGVGNALKRHAEEFEFRKKETGQTTTQAIFASVFKNMDSAVAIKRSTILLPNPAFTKLLGYSAGELKELTVKDLVSPQCRAAVNAADARQQATGEPYELDTVLVRKGAGYVPVHLTSAMVHLPDMQPFSVLTLRAAPEGAAQAAQVKQVLAGSIMFLGLDTIKAALGNRWEEVRNRLMQAAENILKRRLADTDIYSRSDDDGFSIWFKEGTEEECNARIARIGREIQIALLSEFGEETHCSVDCHTQYTEVADPNASPSVVMATLNQKFAERRREAEQQARDLLEEVMQEQPRELTPVCNSQGQATGWAFTDLPRALKSRFTGAMSLVGGHNFETDIDLLRLGLAAQSAMDDSAQGKNGVAVVTLSAKLVLQRQTREQFIKQWRTFGPAVGPRLFIMLSDVPRDVSQTRLAEAARTLQSMAKGVGVLVDDIDKLPFPLEPCPFSVIGFSSEAVGATPEAKLRAFVLRAHQAKAKLLVRLAKGESPRRWSSLGVDLTSLA